MKLFSNLFSDSTVSAFGWTLIHSIWQGTLLMLLAVAAFHLLRRRSANLKYLTGVGFLFAQILVSAGTFFYYQLKTTAVATSGKYLASYVALSGTNNLRTVTRDLPLTFKVQIWLTTHLQELVVCWLIGSGILLLRFAGGWIFTERLRFKAKIVMDKEWRARFGVITAKMNISKAIEFRETAKIVTPMVIGALSPVVLIPIGLLSGFSTAQVEAILAHELAHIRRNDYLVNMLQSFVEVIFFFHPAIWWLSDRIRAEREHCCDDIALAVCGDKMSLAHALVKVAEWQTSPGLAMAFASKKPLLLHRVQRVLGLSPKPARTFSSLPIIVFAFGLAIGVSAYAVAQKSEKARVKKATKQLVEKRHPNKSEIRIEEEINEVAEISPIEEVQAEINEVDFDDVVEIDFGNDSIHDAINRKIRALQAEMEPYHHRMEELNLEIEKQRFEVERFHREIEKIEWKKNRAAELRSDLMEKRSVLFDHDDKPNQSKLSDSELDKQLADFEQQIKAQEQIISELNGQIASARKEAFKAEEPVRAREREMEELNEKIDEIGRKMGLETLSYPRSEGRSVARVGRASRGARSIRSVRTPPLPPPAPLAAPAKIRKPTPAPAPPKPPKAPKKD
ncbi:M56 family metallopeptidase [Dyadobacter sp. MSC1_007]|jgi:bla regulator protein BlaR1|uniref:M56 family metallopeptidase n=1 Tax=Dyadobacter sp. MSC1_007 TaxID=2909264 RepID=UPI00202FA7AB|nr:M56 family metallopeptidase [Dyadobacter sp. MSC1_007]